MRPPSFALVFVSEDPPSKEVVRKLDFFDQPGEMVDGALRKLKRLSWDTELPCTILRTGTEKGLRKLRVTKEGTVFEPDDDVPPGQQFVSTRHREQQLQREALARVSKDGNVQRLGERLLEEGPDALIPEEGTSARPRVSRLPIQRPEEELSALDSKIKNLECYTKKTNDREVYGGIEVYYNAARLLWLSEMFTDPMTLYKNLIERLATEEVLCNPALSRSGRNATVEIPEDIFSAARGFVETQCNIKLSPEIHQSKAIANWLYTKSHPSSSAKRPRLSHARRWARVAPAPTATVTTEVTTPLGSTTPVSVTLASNSLANNTPTSHTTPARTPTSHTTPARTPTSHPTPAHTPTSHTTPARTPTSHTTPARTPTSHTTPAHTPSVHAPLAPSPPAPTLPAHFLPPHTLPENQSQFSIPSTLTLIPLHPVHPTYVPSQSFPSGAATNDGCGLQVYTQLS